MTYDFYNRAGETFGFSQFFWPVLVELAKRYGWKPQGTAPPEDEEPSTWRGSYTGNCGQIVTATDANALADAIEALLTDPNFATVVKELAPELRRQAEDWSSPFLGQVIIEHVSPGPIDGFMTSNSSPGQIIVEPPDREELRAVLQEFIAFCRKGEFEID